MAYFKIKSITNKLPKRHTYFNAALDVSINAKFDKEVHKLRAGGEMVVNADNLPLSVHKLRAQKLVEVIKITEETYKKQEVAKNNLAVSTAPASKPVPVIIAPAFVERGEEEDDDGDDEEKKSKRRQRKH